MLKKKETAKNNKEIKKGEETNTEISNIGESKITKRGNQKENNKLFRKKSSVGKFKKIELVMEKIEITPWRKVSKKIRNYFFSNHQSNIEILMSNKDKGTYENFLDWRLNNDFKENSAYKLKLNLVDQLFSFSLLYKDFNQTTMLQTNFIILDLFRQILFSIIIVGFFDNSFYGMLLINMMNFTYLVGFIIIKPFKSRIDNFQTIINEILLSIICFSVLYMAFMDKLKDRNEKLKMGLGWLIVITNTSLIGIFLMRMFFNLMKLGKKILKNIRQNDCAKKKKKIIKISTFLIQTQKIKKKKRRCTSKIHRY